MLLHFRVTCSTLSLNCTSNVTFFTTLRQKALCDRQVAHKIQAHQNQIKCSGAQFKLPFQSEWNRSSPNASFLEVQRLSNYYHSKVWMGWIDPFKLTGIATYHMRQYIQARAAQCSKKCSTIVDAPVIFPAQHPLWKWASACFSQCSGAVWHLD